jgi:DNA ligase-1
MPREGIMLCYPFEERRFARWGPGPHFIQKKLDGERCRAVFDSNGKVRLISSEGNLFQLVPHIQEALQQLGLKDYELDGELYTHGLSFNEIHSIASRRVNKHGTPELLEYHIFDVINQEPQNQRFRELSVIREDIKYARRDEELKVVTPQQVETVDDIFRVFEDYVESGYEGIILRKRQNLYQRKRSTEVMKFKPYKEDIYEVIGFEEEINQYGSPKGALGAFICRGDDNTPFNVGSGPVLTRQGREFLWAEREYLKGQYLKVKYQTLTSARGVPRFGVALNLIDLKPYLKDKEE